MSRRTRSINPAVVGQSAPGREQKDSRGGVETATLAAVPGASLVAVVAWMKRAAINEWLESAAESIRGSAVHVSNFRDSWGELRRAATAKWDEDLEKILGDIPRSARIERFSENRVWYTNPGGEVTRSKVLPTKIPKPMLTLLNKTLQEGRDAGEAWLVGLPQAIESLPRSAYIRSISGNEIRYVDISEKDASRRVKVKKLSFEVPDVSGEAFTMMFQRNAVILLEGKAAPLIMNAGRLSDAEITRMLAVDLDKAYSKRGMIDAVRGAVGRDTRIKLANRAIASLQRLQMDPVYGDRITVRIRELAQGGELADDSPLARLVGPVTDREGDLRSGSAFEKDYKDVEGVHESFKQSILDVLERVDKPMKQGRRYAMLMGNYGDLMTHLHGV
jgi:hypothetical protein